MKLILISFLILIFNHLITSLHLLNRTSFNNESELLNSYDQSIEKGRSITIEDEIWFMLTADELIERDIIFNYPPNLRPIRKEPIYFEKGFLLKVKWIEVDPNNKNNVIKEKFYFKNERDRELKKLIKREDYQVLFYDIIMSDPNVRFMNTILQNSNNINGSKKVEAYQFFDPIKIQSRYDLGISFNARVYDSDDNEMSFYVSGNFKEFGNLNFNRFPVDIATKVIHVSRLLLDYHYQKEEHSKLFHYSEITKDRLVDLKEKDQIFCYLDYYNYTLHIGRFQKFVENAWLMFLKIRDSKTGQYYLPYRVISPNNYLQNEKYFYEIDKSKIKAYFRLHSDDNDYLKIFNKIEIEDEDADSVWMSDILLQYLKFFNPTNHDLINYAKTNPNRLTYKEMVDKMCKINKNKLTRLITLHITQDYNLFSHGQPMYQYNFSSSLILRWTCYPINEKDCNYKTYSIVCRYLNKNFPSKFFPTNISNVWPLPWLQTKQQPEPTIPPFIPRPPRFTSNDSITDNFFRDTYPNVKFKYSSADRPAFNLKFIILSILFSFVFSSLLKYFYQ